MNTLWIVLLCLASFILGAVSHVYLVRWWEQFNHGLDDIFDNTDKWGLG